MTSSHDDKLSFDLSETQLASYLKRIGIEFSGSVKEAFPPTLETLKKMHRSQVVSITFENLSIPIVSVRSNNSVAAERISIDPQQIFEKLVEREQRGGYCFELNGLICSVLRTLGFRVQPILARVLFRVSEVTGFSHEALVVHVDEGDEVKKYLVDTGFGPHCMRNVMALPSPGETEFSMEGNYVHRLVYSDDYEAFMVSSNKELEDGGTDRDAIWREEAYEHMYIFDLRKVYRGDILSANFDVSYDPHSLFVELVVAGKPTEYGRVSLVNQKITVFKEGSPPMKVAVETAQDMQRELEKYLDIILTEEEATCLLTYIKTKDDMTSIFA